MTDMNKTKPNEGEIFTARQIKENGWSPCIGCPMPHLCAEQCMWAYWNSGDRENTRYRYSPDRWGHDKWEKL